MIRAALIAVTVCAVVFAQRDISLDREWRFFRGDVQSEQQCDFPVDLGQTRCLGLGFVDGAASTLDCAQACCAQATCATWQFCVHGAPCASYCQPGCWIGAQDNCAPTSDGWVSRARNSTPPPPAQCTVPFCQPAFDDSSWRHNVEAPHDFSIEPLPARATDTSTPVLSVRAGEWLFHAGDNASWAAPDLDDSGWTSVLVPSDWRAAPLNYTGSNVYGWYRRHFTLTPALLAAAATGQLPFALGTVAGADTTFINGVQIGSTGTGENCNDYLTYRRYVVGASVLTNGTNVVAVRVFSEGGATFPGGLFDSGAADARVGSYDPGASPGQRQTGYTVGGVAWYRNNFSLTGAQAGGQSYLRFDGVYMNSDVWVNGYFVGNHPYGYTTFQYDVTPYVAAGDNVVAVRVANTGSNSRWYSGSGLFRHVWLDVVPAVHVAQWGVGVDTVVSDASATVSFNVTVQNNASHAALTNVEVLVNDPSGALLQTCRAASVSVPAGALLLVRVVCGSAIAPPLLWAPATPHVYTATVTLVGPTGATDTLLTPFGLRYFNFSAAGLSLNGVSIKLYGGCVHHDNGPLGSATIDRAEERRVQTLKDNGYNAIRTSHNPVSPAFVAACDKVGVILLEEAFDCFDDGKNKADYHVYFDAWWQRDLTSMVLRDRNHPSILMWSIGNEIPMRDTPQGVAFAHELAALVRALDPTGRPVTSAVPFVSNNDDAYISALDVAGYNYSPQRYVSDHERFPSRIIVATESFPAQSYTYWAGVWANSWVIGDFIWTAIDYIGESSIGSNGANTPSLDACNGYCTQPFSYHVSFCGDIDLVGLKKPQSFYRNVLWNMSQLELAVHAPIAAGQHEVVGGWGWPDERQTWSWGVPGGTSLQVRVFSRFPRVQLFLNGAAASSPTIPQADFTAAFLVAYQPGVLTVVASALDGTVLANKSFASAGTPAALRLVVDRAVISASRNDVAYVLVEVVDAAGTVVPVDAVGVNVTVDGPGEIAALGTGDPNDLSPTLFAASRGTYRGQVMAIVRPGSAVAVPVAGSLTVTAVAPSLGLTASTVVQCA